MILPKAKFGFPNSKPNPSRKNDFVTDLAFEKKSITSTPQTNREADLQVGEVFVPELRQRPTRRPQAQPRAHRAVAGVSERTPSLSAQGESYSSSGSDSSPFFPASCLAELPISNPLKPFPETTLAK